MATNPLKHNLITFLDRIVPPPGDSTEDELRKLRILTGFLLNATVLSALMGLVRLIDDGLIASTIITVTGTALFTLTLLILRSTRSLSPAGDITVVLSIVIITFIGFTDHGLESRSIIWYPVVPMIGAFVGKHLRGAGTTVLVIISLILLLLASHYGLILPSDTDSRQLIPRLSAGIGATLFIALSTYLYDHSQRLADIKRQKLDRAKNEWVSLVSHELRTPLTAIRGSLGLITSGKLVELSGDSKKIVDIAYNNCERLVRLVNDVLDIEKIENGKLQLRKNMTDIVPLLQDIIDSNKDYANSFNVSFELEVNKDTAAISIDADRITQVIQNLVSNAIKFSPDGSTVTIKAISSPTSLDIYVSDQGTGIPPEFMHQIFNKFSQADSGSERSNSGSGLGLAISKAIIEQHDGKLDYASNQKGTTFHVTLFR